jgi:hypothetical protein
MLTKQGASRLIQTEFSRLVRIDIDLTELKSPLSHVYHPLEFVIAEKTFTTIIIKSLEQTPKFSVKSDQNVEEWLQDLTE